MDRDNLKGKMDDIKGRIKRQTGEWTGDQKMQDEGTGDQIKGKAQNAWGKVKEGTRDIANKEGTRDIANDVRSGVDRMKDGNREDTDRDIDRHGMDRKRDAA